MSDQPKVPRHVDGWQERAPRPHVEGKVYRGRRVAESEIQGRRQAERECDEARALLREARTHVHTLDDAWVGPWCERVAAVLTRTQP